MTFLEIFHRQAVVEILKQGKINPATMDDEKKRETVENYIAFKSLMFKIDKDEDEYDDDGNLIPNHPQVLYHVIISSSKCSVLIVLMTAGVSEGAPKPGNALCRLSSEPR